MDQDILPKLEQRLGLVHARQRLGIESDHEAQIFGQGLNFFHIENWYSGHSLIRNVLRLTGLYWRGRCNAERVELRRNIVRSTTLPSRFDGLAILHLSDLHVEMNQGAMRRVVGLGDPFMPRPKIARGSSIDARARIAASKASGTSRPAVAR